MNQLGGQSTISPHTEFRGVLSSRMDEMRRDDKDFYWFLDSDNTRGPNHIVVYEGIRWDLHVFPFAKRVYVYPSDRYHDQYGIRIVVESSLFGEEYESEYHMVAMEGLDPIGNLEYRYGIADTSDNVEDVAYGTLQSASLLLRGIYLDELRELNEGVTISQLYFDAFKDHDWSKVFDAEQKIIAQEDGYIPNRFRLMGSISTTEGPLEVEFVIVCIDENCYSVRLLEDESNTQNLETNIPGYEVIGAVESLVSSLERASQFEELADNLQALVTSAIENVNRGHRGRRKFW